MCDSSPQAGRDWLISEYTAVDHDELDGVFDAVSTLYRLGMQGELGQDEAEERESQSCFLWEVVRRHVLPPAAMGAARTSLPHKMHALLHQIYLEHGSWSRVEAFCDSVACITTDQGTEAGLPRVFAAVCSSLPTYSG